jgi:hypothetical protein
MATLADREVWAHHVHHLFFIDIFFRWFCLPSGIGEVEAAMTHWNSVSSYLMGVRFGVNKEPVGVCITGSVNSLRILAIGVSMKGLMAVGISGSSRGFIDSYFFLFISGTDVIFLPHSVTSLSQRTTSGRLREEPQCRRAVDTVWRLKMKSISRVYFSIFFSCFVQSYVSFNARDLFAKNHETRNDLHPKKLFATLNS